MDELVGEIDNHQIEQCYEGLKIPEAMQSDADRIVELVGGRTVLWSDWLANMRGGSHDIGELKQEHVGSISVAKIGGKQALHSIAALLLPC